MNSFALSGIRNWYIQQPPPGSRPRNSGKTLSDPSDRFASSAVADSLAAEDNTVAEDIPAAAGSLAEDIPVAADNLAEDSPAAVGNLAEDSPAAVGNPVVADTAADAAVAVPTNTSVLPVEPGAVHPAGNSYCVAQTPHPLCLDHLKNQNVYFRPFYSPPMSLIFSSV